MPAYVPEIRWEDGLLLRPHHLQAFQRHCQGLIAQLALTRTFGYGVRQLEIRRESIGNWVLEILRCELVLSDGTLVIAGETAAIPPLEFRHLELDAPSLEVWLGVPFLENRASNVWAGGRFQVERMAFADENTGQNPQEIGIKKLNGRLFVGQRPPQRHATLKIAELRKVVEEGSEGRRYELSPDYVPASLSLEASPRLHGVLKDVLHKVEEKNEELLGHLRGRRDLLTGESMDRPETLLKLQATNSILPVLRQITAQPEMHPYDVYLQLCRLIGDLAIFSEDWRPPKLAFYEHDDPLRAFLDFKRVALALLAAAVDTTVERRPFEVTQEKPKVLEASIPDAFLAEGVRLYLGIETTAPATEIAVQFSTGVAVLAAPDEIREVRNRRIVAVPAVVDANLHPSLRDRTGIVFLRIHADGPFWDDVREKKRIAVAGEAAEGEARFFLYGTGIQHRHEPGESS
jgi:type VI secretion system protein ImpJ